MFGFEYGKNAGIHAPTRVGDTELLYDSNGNLIEDGSFIYAYNDANQLVEVLKKAENNRIIAEFFYDESGSRVKKIEDGIVSYYITEDYDIEDGEGTVYYFANGNRVAKNSDEGMFWYLDDHLGSTNVMIDIDGELVERTLYYPFGSHREGGEEKYSFTGKEFDSEIGLYYYGARYYNSETFVFTQADTIIPNVYYPQALNRYSYCYNNPVGYEDPDGHTPLLVTAAIGAGVGALIGGGIVAYKQYKATGSVSDWKAVGKAAAVGAVVGGVAGLTMGVGVGLASGTIMGTAGTTATSGGVAIFGSTAADYAAGAIVYAHVGMYSGLASGIAGDIVDGDGISTTGGDLIMYMAGGAAGGLASGTTATAASSTLSYNSAGNAFVSEVVSQGTQKTAELSLSPKLSSTSQISMTSQNKNSGYATWGPFKLDKNSILYKKVINRNK